MVAGREDNIPSGLRDEARLAGEAAFATPGVTGVDRSLIPRLPGLAANYSYTITIDTGLANERGEPVMRSVVINTSRQLGVADLRDRGIDALINIANSKRGQNWYEQIIHLNRADMSLTDIDAIYRK